MFTFFVDEITPCLVDNKTGDIVETEVIRIRRKSFLKKYNKNNGWYTNWSSELDQNEVYALVVKGTVDIQGLISLRLDSESKEVYASWGCVAPESNRQIAGDEVRYRGIGGHLFAIVCDKSVEYGKDGRFYGFAANEKLLEHYIDVFNAMPVKRLHPYHFLIDEESADAIRKEYTYEWTDEEV